MHSEMSGVINLKESGALFGTNVYTKMYCTIMNDMLRSLNMYTSEKRKHSPHRKIVFRALLHVKIPSAVDTKNSDAIDLVLAEK